VVQNDNTVRFGPHLIDIPASRQRPSYVRARVELHERFDGTLFVYLNGICLAKQVRSEPKTTYHVGKHSDANSRRHPNPHKQTNANPPASSGVQGRPIPGSAFPWSADDRIAEPQRGRNRGT
jgi:hypothetical protein